MASMGLYPKHNLTLRIYVYTHKDADGLRELNTGLRMSLTVCSIGMWGTQTVLHKFLENSFVRTLDPHEADYFFVPAYPKCASDREKIPEDRLNKLYIKVRKLSGGSNSHADVYACRSATCAEGGARWTPGIHAWLL
jgi:hypothetical protein